MNPNEINPNEGMVPGVTKIQALTPGQFTQLVSMVMLQLAVMTGGNSPEYCREALRKLVDDDQIWQAVGQQMALANQQIQHLNRRPASPPPGKPQ